MPSNQQSNEDGIRGAVKDMLIELKENRRAIDAQLEVIGRRIEGVPDKLDLMRRELLGLFVTRNEYDPKHQVVLDKLRVYDQIIADSSKQQAEYQEMKAQVKQTVQDLKDVKAKSENNPARLMQYIAILVAVLSFLVNLFQHIQVK